MQSSGDQTVGRSRPFTPILAVAAPPDCRPEWSIPSAPPPRYATALS